MLVRSNFCFDSVNEKSHKTKERLYFKKRKNTGKEVAEQLRITEKQMKEKSYSVSSSIPSSLG
jgi:hypothetical protein